MAKYGQFRYSQAKYGTGAGAGGTPPGDPVDWTATGGGNHGGEDWILAADTEIAGVHRNVGRFSVEPGVLATVKAWDGASYGQLEVNADDIEISGSLIASAAGYRGGAAALSGEGPFGGIAAAGPVLTALQAWYKADSIVGLSDGAAVATWLDSSGNLRDASQGTPANRPIYKTAIVNGLPIVRFAAASAQWLDLPNFLTGFTAGEIFIVVKAVADPPATGFTGGLWNLSADPTLNTHYPFSDGVIYDGFGATVRQSTVNPTPALTSWRVYNVTSQAGSWVSRLDGTQIFSTGTNVVGFPTNPRLGTSHDLTVNFDGDVAELLLFDVAIGATDRAQVQNYLNVKYALAAAAAIDGGYLAAGGQGDASTDTSGVKGSGGGGGPAQPGGSGGALVRFFAAARIRVNSAGLVHAHGAPEGEAAAGHGAGGGIVLYCDGPYGVTIDGEVKTLGGGSLTVNGGTLKEFSRPGALTVSGVVSAGRTYSDTTLRKAGLVT